MSSLQCSNGGPAGAEQGAHAAAACSGASAAAATIIEALDISIPFVKWSIIYGHWRVTPCCKFAVSAGGSASIATASIAIRRAFMAAADSSDRDAQPQSAQGDADGREQSQEVEEPGSCGTLAQPQASTSDEKEGLQEVSTYWNAAASRRGRIQAASRIPRVPPAAPVKAACCRLPPLLPPPQVLQDIEQRMQGLLSKGPSYLASRTLHDFNAEAAAQMKAGEYAAAAATFGALFAKARQANLTHPELYVCHSNCAAAYLHLGLHSEALQHANKCQQLAQASLRRQGCRCQWHAGRRAASG